jgi:hypothetical protein
MLLLSAAGPTTLLRKSFMDQILKFTMRYMMKLPTAIQAPAMTRPILVMLSFQTLP